MNGTNEWDTPTKEVSVKEMDNALINLRAIKEEYASVDAIAKECHKRLKAAEGAVIQILKDAGKGTFITEGIGRATISEKLSVATPKSIEEKVAFFNWIENNLGEETRDAYMTVSSASLNKFYQEQSDLAAERGEVLEIDGLQPPTSRSILSFRKA
jgi:exonuclease VII small subunit